MKGNITLFDAGAVKIYTNGQGDYDVQIRNGNSDLMDLKDSLEQGQMSDGQSS